MSEKQTVATAQAVVCSDKERSFSDRRFYFIFVPEAAAQ
jgi:hypothetical protein